VSPAKTSRAECERIILLLKEERERRGLSKYAVAQDSGLSQPSIGYIEKGRRIPSLETVLRLARAINVDFAEIIKQAQKEISVEQKQTKTTNRKSPL
jgi:transcriptional regulator with XRE-family HTH domain